ncbi:MAG: putative HTH-type transcriptional regulator YbaQ [Candidatus Anoxychlamydiales bacterium]|nr:putative HTH-type transcriptional regulator YbaQ [Candidatus Anoxychlamydiales bacterium]NGX35604.1 putative HTH-type transcriptional regulator YbaQ [Candidatus Anoxychlamydiales bacterium]
MTKKRKPTHPGIILEEHYIIPLDISMTQLSEASAISRKTLYKIINEEARITARIAVRFAKVFETTPEFWLNLQQKYDIWLAEHDKQLCIAHIRPISQMIAACHH